MAGEKRVIRVSCPTCKVPVDAKNPEMPFCSPRCRLIDLGKWASGAYVISEPLSDVDKNNVDIEDD